MNWQKLYAQVRRLVATFCDRVSWPPSGYRPAAYHSHLSGLRIAPEQVYSGHPRDNRMEVTKALAALRPLYGKGNVEIVTRDGHRVRGIVRSMKTTQALSIPTVKMERADGEVVKIPFTSILEIINHNRRPVETSS